MQKWPFDNRLGANLLFRPFLIFMVVNSQQIAREKTFKKKKKKVAREKRSLHAYSFV